MFLREVRIKVKGKEYRYWKALESYWDRKTKKNRHKTIMNLRCLTGEQVKQIKNLLAMKTLGPDSFVTTLKEIEIGESYEFLNISIFDRLFRRWELDTAIKDTGKTPLVPLSVMAEILTLNRSLSPNSDYRVSNWYQTTMLPQILATQPSLVNPTRIYRSLDEIYLQEEEIQKHLAAKIPALGFDDLSLILYDITSTYFEGYHCPIARFGLSRDHRKDRPQVLLALAVTKEGFPFFWRVLSGEIHDSATVKETVTALKERFKVGKICLVMDKGMVNKDNLEGIEKDNLSYLVTIPKTSFRKLSSFPKEMLLSLAQRLETEAKKEEPDYQRLMGGFPYFTYHSKRAYFHPLEGKEEDRRYVLCFNPEKFAEERKQRAEKIASIEKRFNKWNEELLKAKKTRDKGQTEKEIFVYLEKRKAQGLFTTGVTKRNNKTLQIKWQINIKKLNLMKITDGCYCIKTNLPKETDPAFLVSSYRQRREVEVAFSYLKGFVEIRPLYHHKEERVKAHITICILAYLLQVTCEYLLKKAGFNLSFPEFLFKTSQRRAVDVKIENLKKEGQKLPEVPQEITNLLKALQITTLKDV